MEVKIVLKEAKGILHRHKSTANRKVRTRKNKLKKLSSFVLKMAAKDIRLLSLANSS